MSRPGLTYQIVASAAAELLAQDINPTVETIRSITRTGSHGTIAMHLRAWKAKQLDREQIVLQEKLPESLVAHMKGLWQNVVTEAEGKIQKIQEVHEVQNTHFQTQMHTLASEKLQLLEQQSQLQRENEILINQKNNLEHLTVTLQQENTALGSKQETLQVQLNDKEIRIEELHRLHQQTQANLEHYRESVREERLLEQQRFSIQIQQLEQTIHQFQTNHTTLLQEKLALIHDNEHLKEQLPAIQETNAALQREILIYETNMTALDKKLMESEIMQQQLQKQIETLQQQIENQHRQIIELQNKNNLQTHELSSTKQSLKTLEADNQQLNLEKWELVQENATLQGQLKQTNFLLKNNSFQAIKDH